MSVRRACPSSARAASLSSRSPIASPKRSTASSRAVQIEQHQVGLDRALVSGLPLVHQPGEKTLPLGDTGQRIGRLGIAAVLAQALQLDLARDALPLVGEHASRRR